MTRSTPASPAADADARLVTERRRTERAQAAAADPRSSAWVSANAGAGKTHVLTMRVLRLLLAGVPPERILCLTYTKAAAAEMSKRIFDVLADWVVAPDASLARIVASLLGRTPEPEDLRHARRLFTLAIETPGGFKVQTIHAFCERLLQRFPLEAGIPPQFAILDDETRRKLLAEATGAVFSDASSANGLRDALVAVAAYAHEGTFETLVLDIAGKRDWIAAAGALDGWGLRTLYANGMGVDPSRTCESVDIDCCEVLGVSDLARAAAALARGTPNDQKLGRNLGDAAQTIGAARIRALRGAFLTADGAPRAEGFITKGTRQKEPAVAGLVTEAKERFCALVQERAALTLLDATVALVRLGAAVLARYEAAKAARAALDFDDLIAATARLLSDRGAAEWVLYKLDGGLDHILVDEAQDTSPVQWRVVEALAAEFFAGSGAREEVRTVFAVGDEKQSIYSFQGAAPKMCAGMGEAFAERAEHAGMPWQRVPLTLSFRTIAPLLEAVDHVFADRSRTPGLTAADVTIQHIANRAGHGGFIEVWAPEQAVDRAQSSAWRPLDDAGIASPVRRLAERIAGTIRKWLDTGEMLVSEGRAIRAGDIIVLVRRRNPLAAPIVAALKNAGVPVAGADRMVLTDQIAVMDLVVLCKFLLLPEDDLALATVLKSPLFDLDDDDLMTLGAARTGTLWSSLLAHAERNVRYRFAADMLKRWRGRADFVPPYEFLSGLLDRDGMRSRLLDRLGSEAADPLDELLEAAVTFDESEPPSLQAFISRLAESGREIKRDMEHGRDEVRVMTVHGAKGLEAPVVFLPDACWSVAGGGNRRLLDYADMARSKGLPAPFLWRVKGTSGTPAARKAAAGIETAEREERNRLLYVALTRARDRLYVTGVDGKRKRDSACWYDLVVHALDGVLSPAVDGVRRYGSEQAVPPVQKPATGESRDPPVPLPSWATRPAPRVPQTVVPLVPSRLAPLETDASGDPVDAEPGRQRDPPSLPPGQLAGATRFLRGTLTHALLQHLPDVASDRRHAAAEAFAASRGAGLSLATRASIVRETLAVLDHPDFAPLFGPESRAEVPIVADILAPDGPRNIWRPG